MDKIQARQTCYCVLSRPRRGNTLHRCAGKRVNLITIPSCKTHNYNNAENVEYFRNIVVTDIHINHIGREILAAKVRRS